MALVRKVLAVVVGVGVVAALALGDARAQAERRGGTIRVGITQEILNLDPHVATAFSSFQVLDLVYESLLRLNPRTLALEPNLAQSWSVSPNGLEYTFTLRRDATFHDGSAVDASDVKYTIERILNPATRSPQASFLGPVREVTVVSPFVVRITLAQPFAPLLSVLADNRRSGIVPVNFEEKVGTPQTRTLGSGPYQLAEFAATGVRLVRHERYWRKDAEGTRLPYADAVVFRVIPDPATLRAAVRAGEVEMIIGFGVDVTAARTLRDVAGLRVVSTPDLSYSLVGLQVERGPLADVRVRQALSLATDRQKVVELVYSGRAAVGGPLPPTLEEWAPLPPGRLPHYRPDVGRARQLLAQAGQPRLALRMMPIPTVPEAVQIAQVLKEQWAQAGVTVELEQVDFATFLARWRGSQFDTFVSLNGGATDPDIHLYRHLHSTGSTNVFKFKDPTLDQLLDQARATPDPRRRVQLYAQAQQRIADQVPFLFIAYADLFAVMRTQLQGFVLTSTRSMAPLAESWVTASR